MQHSIPIPQGRVHAEIDLGKLKENFAVVKKLVAPAAVAAVLKADAYGMGASRIGAFLAENGAAAFGVADLTEALDALKFGRPVMILGGLFSEEIPDAVRHGVYCPLISLEMAKAISDEAVRQKRTAQCQLTIDSGMGRIGLRADDCLETVRKIAALPNLNLAGIYSHFSCASNCRDPYSHTQLARFKHLLQELTAIGIAPQLVHIAASDGLRNFHEADIAPFTMVRCGICMYGFNVPEDSLIPLKQVWSLKTRLIAIRELPEGSSLGYNRLYKLPEKTRVGTIAAGYADGLPLALSNRGYVLVGGRLAPILGRISMDYTTISLAQNPDAKIGDEVVLIGTQGDHSISLEEWGKLKGTHAHELLCSVGNRVKRVYLE
ncbi:MAG: alanine racemase [Victivallaceae bacterium]|nr:alanine racemase [Victivallaceae bacterium]